MFCKRHTTHRTSFTATFGGKWYLGCTVYTLACGLFQAYISARNLRPYFWRQDSNSNQRYLENVSVECITNLCPNRIDFPAFRQETRHVTLINRICFLNTGRSNLFLWNFRWEFLVKANTCWICNVSGAPFQLQRTESYSCSSATFIFLKTSRVLTPPTTKAYDSALANGTNF